MVDELDGLPAEPAPVETTTALTLNNGDVEIIRGKPTVHLDAALRLIAEFNRLFPNDMIFTLAGRDWMSLPDEVGVFDNAFKLKMDQAEALLGLVSGTKGATLSEEVNKQFHDLLFPRKGSYSTPDIRALFADRKIRSIEEIRALVDDEKGPLDRSYIEACIRDARIDVQVLFRRMSNRMDLSLCSLL